ncbi:MAG: hypothetical protein O3A95_08030 [Planctomycetota bacterium]|nr:hypothetical protein [Planctomycetota bacterium]MDA1114230.1 hypothetical protein [Planctomycetota bacterium]
MFATILLLASPLLPQQEQDLGGQVRQLFADKCVHCHHPEAESRKAKREFDQAWDLRAVAKKWGDDLDPESALLIEIAEDRSMPPKDSDYAPITEAEAELLMEWTLARTPMPADGNPFVDLEMAALYLPQEAKGVSAPVEKSLWQRILILLGHFHAPIIHFPVAFLLMAPLLRLGYLRSGKEACLNLERFCFWMGAPSAVVAAGLGWLNASNSGAGGHDLFLHRWIGVGVATTAVLLLLLHARCGHTKWYTLLTLALGLAIAWGAHMGGEMVFGDSYMHL